MSGGGESEVVTTELPNGERHRPQEHHLTVTRTARYVTLGRPHGGLREVWIVCHGHGQLASRFARHVAPLDDGTRLVVGPEALSRFYLDSVESGPASERRVGATWMTREDRLSEINDYVSYLDALYTHLFRQLDRASVRLHVFGFSQGAATACRWVAAGRVRPDEITLWAGHVPPDLDLAGDGARLGAARLWLAVGSQDQFSTPAAVAQQEQRLREAGIAYRLLLFEGGHVLDPAALRRLASLSALPHGASPAPPPLDERPEASGGA